MNVLSLFSGIGGFSLGLGRAEFKTVALCEIERFPRAVLTSHWPEARLYDDVRKLTGTTLKADGISADVITGGFPCQDISLAGAGAGIDGKRSGLWFEFRRLIEEIRPRWVIAENVAALRARGLDRVLRSLAEVGYDAEWHCIPASALGAPHRRDRIWIIAYPNKHDVREQPRGCGRSSRESSLQPTGYGGAQHVANSYSPRLEIILERPSREQPTAVGGGWWAVEPDVGRVAYGVPHRVDRLRALGNTLVPQIPEAIGLAIMRWENQWKK